MNALNLTLDGDVPETEGGVVFAFSGQGSYSRRLLRDIYLSYPQTWPYFCQANEATRLFLECEFLPLVTAASEEEHDERLKSCPDLDQIGIYLSSVLTARILMQYGTKPDLLVGHSFGELAALATAGVYTIEAGVRIVCQRVIALQALADAGRMAAVSCSYERARESIDKLERHSLEISVINHPRQTVVSGTESDLDRLAEGLAEHRISLTLLKSRYPYHSSRLRRAVKVFNVFLRSYDFEPAAIPVFLGMEGALYSPGYDLSKVLSSQFIRPLNFSNVVTTIYDRGYRHFIECGGADIVTRIVTQNLAEKADVTARSTSDVLIGAREGSAAKSSDQTAARTAAGPGEQKAASQRATPLAASAQRALTSAEQLPPVALAPSPDDRRRVGANGPPRVRADSDAGAVFKKASVQPRNESHRGNAAGVEESYEMPVAIVSMGCVLPGANNPEQYWRNVLKGTSGIVNLADVEPAAARDYLVGGGDGQVTVVPDKTYTLLHGSIVEVSYDSELLSEVYHEQQFNELSKGQRLLALATAQSLSRLKSPALSNEGGRIQCILGSTADGSKEYDEALFNESLQAVLATLDEPENLRRSFAGALEEIAGYKIGASKEFTQYKMYKAVLEKFLRYPIKTYVVDAACSSSLYSICLGMKALQDEESDVVLAGGVFAPGPANNALFAQFRGLTPRESRPFDAAADGVVFGDGAGIVILKRLPDALFEGDEILGVIRGVGLSSDGKSPSINVPRSDGQAIAIRRAYDRTGIRVDTVQYIEAHATATPVGDAVEFNALKEVLSGRDPALPAIQLGSVKALIGHTGWTAGVASVIKVCKAFESRLIPRQYNYTAPSSEIDLRHSPFVIAATSCPWPENIDGYPRRAGINGFGFGGANAHLILEAFDPVYHGQLRIQSSHNEPRQTVLALVGVGTLFPQETTAGGDNAPALKFKRKSLRLPTGKMLLPDVTEHMDASQYLAGLAAQAVFATMPDISASLKSAIGIVLGLESKTELGVASIERIFVDRLRRRFKENTGRLAIPQVDVDRILNVLIEHVQQRNLPSGPYTLPGLMPNVAAGRIASLFDLNGPNIVVDMAGHSLVQAIWIARQLLSHGDCDLALAGGISANGGTDDRRAEAALLMALTTIETARREAWPVLGTLTLCGADEHASSVNSVPVINPTIDYCGAGGALEIAWAIKQLRTNGSGYRVTDRAEDGLPSRSLLFAPAAVTPTASLDEPSPQASVPTRTYAYAQGTPIACYTPHLVTAAVVKPAVSRRDRRFVFLTDQPDVWQAVENSGALAELAYTVICPAGVRFGNAVPVDLSGEDGVRSSLNALAGTACDTLVAVKSLTSHAANTLLVKPIDSELAWMDLLFAACRHYYERIQDQGVSVVTLCLGAHQSRELDPYTGLVAGFMKSLARELPEGICRIVNTDAIDFREALRLVEIELGQSGGPDEVHYLGGERHVVDLAPVPKLARDDHPYLDSASVVIATGGGRGVTATLAERLLKDFGCRVIAVGRTEPSSVPDEVRRMDVQALENYETEFYRDQLKRDQRAKITDLKRQYLSYRAANEICEVTQRLQTVGRYEYRCLDLTDETATEAFVEAVYRDYNRVDLVLHGAGIQVSKILAKKSLRDFRRIIATKLGGLSYLYKACERHRRERKVHYHLLTSAFSYLGNDGQCDYGAANEAMNRLAVSMNAASTTGHWSSLAWLGWAGIGMTRDSEFAALAASRGLRGVTKNEGQELFSALMRGTPTTPANILLASGEIDYYKVRIKASAQEVVLPAVSATKSAPDALTIERAVSIRTDPYLVHHLVDGTPTLPGALIIVIVAEAAQQLRPSLKIVSFEQAHFHRFIRVYGTRETLFRVHAAVVSEDDGQALVRVRLLSDFVHRNGTVLQKDILQHEIIVRMAAALQHPSDHRDFDGSDGRCLPDPYVMECSPVSLSGPFRTMSNITVGRAFRRADYEFANPSGVAIEEGSMLPTIMLMDALWRFGAIEMVPDGSMPIHVPENCEVMRVYFDFARVNPRQMMGVLTLSGANPREDGEKLQIGPVVACDVGGNMLLSVEGGICRKLGEVRNEFAFQATGT
jgi:acyl transferase domain-containing protein/NAD(P)-dependent dehydrogenase (short-subunit alcohol dehydrogenase family)